MAERTEITEVTITETGKEIDEFVKDLVAHEYERSTTISMQMVGAVNGEELLLKFIASEILEQGKKWEGVAIEEEIEEYKTKSGRLGPKVYAIVVGQATTEVESEDSVEEAIEEKQYIIVRQTTTGVKTQLYFKKGFKESWPAMARIWVDWGKSREDPLELEQRVNEIGIERLSEGKIKLYRRPTPR